jgi:hypothetical protein
MDPAIDISGFITDDSIPESVVGDVSADESPVPCTPKTYNFAHVPLSACAAGTVPPTATTPATDSAAAPRTIHIHAGRFGRDCAGMTILHLPSHQFVMRKQALGDSNTALGGTIELPTDASPTASVGYPKLAAGREYIDGNLDPARPRVPLSSFRSPSYLFPA